MKSFKLILVFAVLVYAIVGVLVVTDVILPEQALDYAGKATAVVVIFGVAAALIANVLGNKSIKSNEPKKPGPNF